MKEEKGSFAYLNVYRKNSAVLDEKGSPLSTQSAVYPKVIVIGGSLAGLCSALSLRFINWDIKVFEKSPLEMKGRGAGIVLQIEIINFLRAQYCTKGGPNKYPRI